MRDKERFVKALAQFLVGDQGMKSIALGMGKRWAQEWSDLRSATPIRGYPTTEEAEAIIGEWLEEENGDA